MKTNLGRDGILRKRPFCLWLLLASVATFVNGLPAWALTPVQATYDVWGGNTLDFSKSFYEVDKMAGYVKLGSTNRSATFFGRYNYYVVAVRGSAALYLDAAQTSSGAYYGNGSLAVGNVGGSADGAFGPPDRVYLVLNIRGSSSGSYGSYAVFYNTGAWTSMRFIVYEPHSAPGLSAQPRGQLSSTGDSVKLGVIGIGDEPMQYQWRKDGVSLTNAGRSAGATSTNLTLTSLELADTGNYSVVITNQYGSITSAPNALTVVAPAQASYDVWGGDTMSSPYGYYNVNTMPGYVKLGTANRTATFNGKYNYYVVAVKKTDLLFLDAAQGPSGAFYNNSSLASGNTGGGVLGRVQGPPDGRYVLLNGPAAAFNPDTYGSYAVFYNTAGWTNVKFFVYSPDAISNIALQPESKTIAAGTTLQLAVSAFSDAPLRHQWRRDGANLANGGRISGATNANLAIAGTVAGDSGDYRCVASNVYGAVTSAVARVSVVRPPSSFVLLDYFNPLVESNEWRYTGTDYDGQPATRVDRVVTRNWPVTAYTGRSAPRAYGTNLVRLNKAYGQPTHDDWDEFFGDHQALSFWGNDDGADSGRVDGGGLFPTALALGQSASVTRDFYQGGVYQGAVTFKITAVSWGSVTALAGTFQDCLKVRLVITGGENSETQEEWWVRGVGTVKHRNVPDNGEEQLDLVSYNVVAPVRIVTPPRPQTNSLGGIATFSVGASGSPPLAYQWRKNGEDLLNGARISGATSNILVLSGLEFGDAGSYSVRVSNLHDSTVSSAAQLVVADKLSPALAITSHTDLQLLTGTTVALAGNASDAGLGDNGIASVTVSGLRATNDTAAGAATAQWIRAVKLAPGTNRFTIVAQDGQGNRTTNVLRLRADNARPALRLTAPTRNQRWSNSVFTVVGRATDNVGVTNVLYQLNAADWTVATPSPSGWINWTAVVVLTPGTNVLRVYGQDVAGNRSLTNTVRFAHVVTAPLGLNVVGKGKVKGATNGQLFEIGKSLALKVTPGAGWILSNWLVQAGATNLRSTNKAVPFLMASNTVVTATFVDVAKPTLTITAPTDNRHWSNEVFTIAGKVTDNHTNGAVWYQLNGGVWTNAGGWTNWSAVVNLAPGTNSLRAYAQDEAGNRSVTNGVKLIYEVTQGIPGGGAAHHLEPIAYSVPVPPTIVGNDGSMGFVSGRFGFNITGQPGQVVIVQVSTNLINWLPVQTNTLGLGQVYFSDPDSPGLPTRFYRIRSP